nr:hypothetical protein [Candidatus Njordarchaeota archaeon]
MKNATYDNVIEYYKSLKVREEIAAYCKRRWVAIHCEKTTPQGVPYLVRYKGWKERKTPLIIRGEADVTKLMNMFGKLSPRAFYGTINEFGKLENPDDTDNEDNIERSTPIWDIDNEINDWRTTIKVARLIVEFLEDNGIKKSVFVKWSGNGAHVHLNPSAFSDGTFKKLGSLNISFATVQFVIVSLKPRFRELIGSTGSKELSVENKIDPKRVFTAPLSLHRNLFRACVCMLPQKLGDFDLSWTDPVSFEHDPNWSKSVRGEADDLAELAFGKIGPCPYTGRMYRRKNPPVDKQIKKYL